MTIHAGILGSLPTDVTSLKLAAISFAGGIALITVILLGNAVVGVTTAVLRSLGRRRGSSFGPMHGPDTLRGTHASCTRSVLAPFPWAGQAASSSAATSGVGGRQPLKGARPLPERAHNRSR